jgi:hypothetical protein
VNAFQQGLAALRYNLTEEQVRNFLTMAKQKDVEHGVNYEQVRQPKDIVSSSFRRDLRG